MSNKYMNQYYKQLIGFRIIKFKYQNDGYGDLFPVFTVKRDDEILELTKEKNSGDQLYYPSRILLKFKNEEVKSLFTDTIGRNTDFKSTLNLSQIQNSNLISVLNLDVFAVSQSWDEGSGRYTNLPTSSNGSSWIYRNNTTIGTKWPTGSAPVGATFGSASIIVGVQDEEI